ncbi:MAG TPA: hypothetical protein VMW62_16195 [Chloroflexota bacterium]|nr:hypothetical protein [Chloroflexota bacterium]
MGQEEEQQDGGHYPHSGVDGERDDEGAQYDRDADEKTTATDTRPEPISAGTGEPVHRGTSTTAGSRPPWKAEKE